jgi:rare lipoprotein A
MNFSLKHLLAFSLAITGTSSPIFAGNGTPKNGTDDSDKKVGYASYYHDKFNGRKTANGETYDKTILSAAHRTLPLGSLIRVKRLDNGKSITLRVNDRGPYSNYMVDLSRAAASELGLVGVKRKVQIEVLNSSPSSQDLADADNITFSEDDQQPPVITAESELQRAGGRAHATKAAAAGEAIPEERTSRRGGRHARGGRHGGGRHAKTARGGRHAKAARGGRHAKAARGGKHAGGGHAKAHKRGRRH